ncbi:MAG: pyridoxal-phosphate dependent enzyme [Myxococcota bacterium]
MNLRLPSPIHEVIPGLWLKDESAVSPLYGGNKVRKLGPLIEEAKRRGHPAVVTSGGLGSHHILATAVHARAQGLDTHAVVFEQPWSADAEAHARASVALCRTVTPCAEVSWVAATVRRLANQHHAYAIAVGGSSVVGTRGWVEGGRELAAQIQARELPAPIRVYVPSASGGTAVGLALGLALAGSPTPVVALRIGRFLTPSRLTRLLERTAGTALPSSVDLQLIDAVAGPLGPLQHLGALDPTYTAPALATCLAHQAPHLGPVVYILTASQIPPPAGPPLPTALAVLWDRPEGRPMR